MRPWIIPVLLLVLLLLFPYQVFVIGNEMGIGIQGAVYRIQVTVYGDSLIPLPQELMYVVNGFYSGKTALSIIIWSLGTLLMTLTVWFGLIFTDSNRPDYYQQIMLGLIGTCSCYLVSLIFQYGILLHGPAGTSLPFGIAAILAWLGIIRYFPHLFVEQA